MVVWGKGGTRLAALPPGQTYSFPQVLKPLEEFEFGIIMTPPEGQATIGEDSILLLYIS